MGLLLIILALVVVVLGLTWVAVSWNSNNQLSTELPANSPATPTPTVATTASQPSSPVPQRTTLTDPSGQNVLGELVKESISADDHRFVVTAKLPDPSGTDFYGVWLTQTEGAEKKFLGRLNAVGGDYVLEYQTNENEQNFDRVVISRGSESDTKVETVVAEGIVASQLLL